MAIAKTAKKSCGTCRGYAFRLSWPSEGDRRRSMAVKEPLHSPSRAGPVSKHLAHVSFWDVQMHRHLTALGHSRPLLQIPMPWNSSELELGSNDLILYFHTSASQSLTTFGHDPKALGQALMRIALTGTTPSAAAVFNSLLALSSLHRYGVQTQAFQLKIATIKALAAATTCNLTAREVIQHAAAGMLLCSFEVHQASCTSSQWTWYISGVKEVLSAPCLKHYSRDSDLNALMDWVYYHDVMSRFTLRHWHGDVLEIPPKPSDMCHKEVYTPVRTAIGFHSIDAERQPTDSSMLANLELLAELSDTVMARPQDSMSTQQMEDYKGYIRILDWRVRNIPTQTKPTSDREQNVVAELFKLATLVYLNRVSGNLLDQADSIQANLNRAFTLFSQIDCCERQYPLFILGCEARTDEQRVTVLDLISRTEMRSSSRSLNHVRILVQALWAQDDLAEKEVDYWDKMSSIISSCTIIPSLV
ncbi:hypothetical protein K505DRAFT_350782 [Melanomma pulvis-pyrius CBS 109.77]|uniref:Transcription factor domain-containing protein n=1 Tax=Melanomma pulvis-pyrius CBS 109.77 TaxID=1314802 RepID=A0A6A6X737_9PLEO|nr:hypothetical protein K505DRAFT_350782 [Melanomma pulvis-pyrius CBS 109.77]